MGGDGTICQVLNSAFVKQQGTGAADMKPMTITFGAIPTGMLKADMKSYILLQTAAIFFISNLYLKQGIGLVMVDFICKGYLELSGTRVEGELQNKKKSRPLWDSNLGPFAYEAQTLPLSWED